MKLQRENRRYKLFQQSDKIDYGMPVKDSTVSKSQPLMPAGTCMGLVGGIL